MDSSEYSRGVINRFTLAFVDNGAFFFFNGGALDLVHCITNFLLHNVALLLVCCVALLEVELDKKNPNCWNLPCQ